MGGGGGGDWEGTDSTVSSILSDDLENNGFGSLIYTECYFMKWLFFWVFGSTIK